MIVNEALVLPAATVTLPGTVAAVLLSVNVTTAPPEGAGPVKVTVPVELLPPVTLVGLTLRELTPGGFTVRLADALLLWYVAEMVATAWILTAVVVAVKVALVAPAGTVTLVGTLTAVLLSCRLTTAPPEGATEDRVTVPVEEFPPVTLVGLRLTELTTKVLPGVHCTSGLMIASMAVQEMASSR